jgi:Trypsin-like peptidase domain
MARAYDRRIEIEVAEYARLAEECFALRFNDTEAFEARLRAGLKFSSAEHAENKVGLTKHAALFSLELFQAMMSGGQSFKPLLVSIMWDRLLDAGIVMKSLPVVKGIPLADHQINQGLLLWHLRDSTFANLFASPARLPERYAHAVAAVDVTAKGKPSRGTGFVVQHEGRQYFVTCRHNVDPADGIELEAVISDAGDPLQLGEMLLSDRYDIAVAKVTRDVVAPCFVFSDILEVFDEVFTLGYPMVPRAESLLLGHRGEMNGRANLYMDKCPALLISNLVSPGSSGGPVLTRDGRCVGMTIRWLEGKWGEEEKLETMRFSAALPAELLREEVEKVTTS